MGADTDDEVVLPSQPNPPEFRLTSVEFIAASDLINGRAVIDELAICRDFWGLVNLARLSRTRFTLVMLGSENNVRRDK